MTRRIFWVALAVGLTACDPRIQTPKTRLSQDQFVAVMVELQLAEPGQRPAILKKHRTSEADLRIFVEEWSAQPRLLGLAFDSIQGRVDRVRFSPPPPPPGVPNP